MTYRVTIKCPSGGTVELPARTVIDVRDHIVRGTRCTSPGMIFVANNLVQRVDNGQDISTAVLINLVGEEWTVYVERDGPPVVRDFFSCLQAARTLYLNCGMKRPPEWTN